MRIDTFGSEEEETAYKAYVRELAAKTLVL